LNRFVVLHVARTMATWRHDVAGCGLLDLQRVETAFSREQHGDDLALDDVLKVLGLGVDIEGGLVGIEFVEEETVPVVVGAGDLVGVAVGLVLLDESAHAAEGGEDIVRFAGVTLVGDGEGGHGMLL